MVCKIQLWGEYVFVILDLLPLSRTALLWGVFSPESSWWRRSRTWAPRGSGVARSRCQYRRWCPSPDSGTPACGWSPRPPGSPTPGAPGETGRWGCCGPGRRSAPPVPSRRPASARPGGTGHFWPGRYLSRRGSRQGWRSEGCPSSRSCCAGRSRSKPREPLHRLERKQIQLT